MTHPMQFPRLLTHLAYYGGVLLAFAIIVLLVNESLELLQAIDRLVQPSPNASGSPKPAR